MPLYQGVAGTVTNSGTFAVQEDGAALTALQLIDNAVSGAGYNITQFNGAAVPIGAGLEATSVRVTLPTDGTGIVGLATGSNAIGKLAANSGVDIGDVDILSIAAGDNNIGNVDIASALPTGSNTIGDVTVSGAALTALQLIDDAISGSEMQVDVVAALPAGTNAIGKLAANSGVDIGDVDVTSIAAGSNTIGNTKDAGPSWTGKWGVSSATVTSADATTPVAVTDAPTGGEKIVITDIIWSVETSVWLEFEEETSGTILFKVYAPADSSGQITPRTPVKLATADKKLMVDAEAASNIAVTVLYYSEA